MAVADQFETVQKLYIAFYQRPADFAGRQYWAEQVEAQGLQAVINAFATSAEATALYGDINSDTIGDVIDQIYQAAFGRAADAEGKAWYVEQFNAGTFTPATIALNVVNGAAGTDETTLGNKVQAADLFTAEVEDVAYNEADIAAARTFLEGVTDSVPTQAEVAAVVSEQIADPAPSVPGDTFTLTENIDVVRGTANDDTILGQEDTADSADQIDGGEGTDTLELYNVTSSAIPNNVANVERLFVIGTNATPTTAVNVNAGSYEQVWAEDGASVAVTNLSATQTVGIDGEATIAGTVAANVTTANLALDDAEGTATLNGASVRTVNVSGSTTTTGVVLAGTATAAATTLNVAATGDIVLDSSAAVAVTTVNVSGSGEVELGTLDADTTTLNASANTGGVTAEVTNASIDVTGGSGSDEITVSAALGSNASINLGAGDDLLLDGGASGSIGNGVTVDGGAGTDAVAASLISAGNGARFVNFEVLNLNGVTSLDLDLLTGSEFTSLQLSGGTNVLENVALTQSLSIVDDATSTTLGFAAATGAADSYSISFDAETTGTAAAPTAIAAGTVTVNGVENINVASGAAAGVVNNSIELASNTAETVTITGDQDLALSFAGGFGSEGAGNEVTAINASAATGDVTVDLANVTADAAGLTVTGGSGDDTFTTDGFAVTLTGNAGDDTFEVAANTGTGEIVKITDFQASDVIDFGATAFVAQSVNVSGATTLAAAFGLADNTDGNVSWFTYGNSTYIVAAGADTAVSTDDTIVQLTGQVDLSNATFVSGELTFA